MDIYGHALAGAWHTSSDKRFKKNIQPIRGAYDIVNSLKGATYEYNLEKFKDRSFSEGKQYGFIAQELKEVLPELVKKDEEGFYGVNYDAIIPILVEALKEQKQKIDRLEEKMTLMENTKTTIGASSANLSSSSDLSAAAEVISLEQNHPNPFSESTMIEYFLPESVNQAMIFIYDMNGKQLKEMSLMEKGRGSVTINGGELNAGMYMYALIADGREVDVKRMILTK